MRKEDINEGIQKVIFAINGEKRQKQRIIRIKMMRKHSVTLGSVLKVDIKPFT